LENNAKVWKDKAFGLSMNSNSNSRYMETAKDGSVRKTWSVEGKMRFTALCHQVRELQSFTLSKNNEGELVKAWNPPSSTNNGPNRGRSSNRNEDERPVSIPVYEIFEGELNSLSTTILLITLKSIVCVSNECLLVVLSVTISIMIHNLSPVATHNFAYDILIKIQ
jgi:hypothetical protein